MFYYIVAATADAVRDPEGGGRDAATPRRRRCAAKGSGVVPLRLPTLQQPRISRGEAIVSLAHLPFAAGAPGGEGMSRSLLAAAAATNEPGRCRRDSCAPRPRAAGELKRTRSQSQLPTPPPTMPRMSRREATAPPSRRRRVVSRACSLPSRRRQISRGRPPRRLRASPCCHTAGALPPRRLPTPPPPRAIRKEVSAPLPPPPTRHVATQEGRSSRRYAPAAAADEPGRSRGNAQPPPPPSRRRKNEGGRGTPPRSPRLPSPPQKGRGDAQRVRLLLSVCAFGFWMHLCAMSFVQTLVSYIIVFE